MAGNYTCTITDICGQTEVRNYTIYSKSSAPLSISLNNVVCETGNTAGLGNKDGKIYLQQPTGGKAPYIFDWKDLGPNEPQEGSRDRLAVESAKYMVCVTDKNGCMVSSDTIVVPFCPAPLAVKNIVIKPVKCFGDDNGEVSFKIEGGHATYVIKWGAAPNQTTTSSDGNVSILNLAGGNYAFTVTFDYKGSSGSFVQNVIVPSPSSAIKIDTAIVRCAKTATAPCNGSIDLTVSGGTLPFTYNWDGGTQTTQDIIDCPSTHKVTITDARGCVLVSPVYNIGLCVPLSITGVVTNIKCANGTEGAINITVSGGSGSYIYNWGTATSEDLTAITSGIYTVTVTDANAPNALGTATFTVSVISTLGVTVSVFGTTANAVVTGGIGNPNNYIYQWGGLPTSPDTNVVTGLSSGVYNVMVTDSLGCSVTTVFTIDAVLSATVVVQKTVSCYKVCDGRAVVTNVIGGTPPYTFKWDNGSTGNNLCVGTHTVTITDGAQRNVIQQFNVDGPTDSLNVVVQTVGITVSGGADGTATATVTGGTSPYTFQWNDLARTKTQVVTNLPVGDLAVVVVDKNGCTAVGIGKVAGIGSNCFDTGKTFTPNGDGLNDEFLINTCDNLQPLTFQIFNRWGQLVYDIKASPTGIWSAWDGKDQSGSDLPEGGYFYVIEVTQSGVTKQYKGSLTLLRQ